jgi:hypothetical protein
VGLGAGLDTEARRKYFSSARDQTQSYSLKSDTIMTELPELLLVAVRTSNIT